MLDAGPAGRYQLWLVFLTALAIVFDGIDNQLLGIAMPAIMSEWGLPRSFFAPVVAAGLFGMMAGGAAAGVLGDRIGRRTALLGSMILFGAATFAVVIVDSTWSLAALRFVAGVGLGGALPNATALAAEYVPLRVRPLAVTLTIVCIPLGGTLAGLLAIPALPAIGWRQLFVVGGLVPMVAAIALDRLLPESPRYLARHPRRWPELRAVLERMGHKMPSGAAFARPSGPPVDRTALRSLFNPALRHDTAALWAAFFSCLLAVYLGLSWLPSILAGAGFGSRGASASITAFNFGGVIGAVAAGFLITRFGSKPTMLTMAAGGAAGAAALGLLPLTPGNAPIVIALLTLTGGLLNAVQTTMYALAANVYPTAVRATGVGAAVAFGRSGAILSGYAGPWALDVHGSAAFFALMAASVTVTIVALALVRRQIVPGGGSGIRGVGLGIGANG